MPNNININSLKTVGSQLERYAKGVLPKREFIPVKTAEGISFTKNSDHGVDKLLESLVPLFPGDKEFISELIIKEHRNNPNLGFNELYRIVEKRLNQRQIGMTTGLREQFVPRDCGAVSKMSGNSILDTIQHKIAKALRDFAQYDLKKVDKVKDGVRIIYEGQKTINGKSVDIDIKGNVLVKTAMPVKPNIPPIAVPSALPREMNVELPSNLRGMIDNMFRLCPDKKSDAYRIATDALKKNPSASIEDILTAIKHEMH